MSFVCHIEPRLSETDALGHINNTALPAWFEFARKPVFALFNPALSFGKWSLILRRIDVEFLRQIYVTDAVEIRTWIGDIGNTSFTVRHEAWQNGELAASGNAVMIHFDYERQTKAAIPPEIRAKLEALQQ